MTKLLLDTDAVLLVYCTPMKWWDKSNCYVTNIPYCVTNIPYCITAGSEIVI